MENPKWKEHTECLKLAQTYLGIVPNAENFEETCQKIFLISQNQNIMHLFASALKIYPEKNLLCFFLKESALKMFLIIYSEKDFKVFLYFSKGTFRTLLYSEFCQWSMMERFVTIANWCYFKPKLEK